MKFFSEVDFFTTAAFMLDSIQSNNAVVLVNERGVIDIAFGDSTDMYYLQREYKILTSSGEMWHKFIYYYDVLLNYIRNTSCATCKYDKIALTEDKIRKLFNVGETYKSY